MIAGVPALAQESSYSFTWGFPANHETIKQVQDATDLRRAREAYKFFFPTGTTEAVFQQYVPHGAVPNKSRDHHAARPEQQLSVANQDTPYIIASLDLKAAGLLFLIYRKDLTSQFWMITTWIGLLAWAW